MRAWELVEHEVVPLLPRLGVQTTVDSDVDWRTEEAGHLAQLRQTRCLAAAERKLLERASSKELVERPEFRPERGRKARAESRSKTSGR